MTGRTGAHAAVKVDAADALVGPALDDGKVQFAGGVRVTCFSTRNLENGTVTIITTLCLGRFVFRFEMYPAMTPRGFPKDAALKFLVECVTGQVFIGMCHEISGILVCLGLMAGAAVFGAYDNMYVVPVVLEGVGMRRRSQHVALGTTHGRTLELRWYIFA